MLKLHTRLCDLLGIEYPIIQAGMGDIALADLASAVSNAGGLGMIGGTTLSPEDLREEIRKTREITDSPFGVDLLVPDVMLPTGSPAELWAQVPKEQLEYVRRLRQELGLPDKGGPKEGWPLSEDFVRRQWQVVVEEKVPVFAAGLGCPQWLVDEARCHNIKTIALVGNVKQALRVVARGVDVVVAQGHEAGGHTGRVGTMALVPQVVDAVRPTPVVAAGGIGDGRGLVAALALGACGAWVGTAFVVTQESKETGLQKRKILAASEEDTRITKVMTGKTSRVLNNKLVELWEKSGVPTLPLPLQYILVNDLLKDIQKANLEDYIGSFAGQISGMMKEIKPARQVVEEMVAEASQILKETLPSQVAL